MNQQQNNVLDWMDTFGQECPAKASIPTLEVRKLRAKLILEEALEIIEGLGLQLEIENNCGREFIFVPELEKNNIKFHEWDEPNLVKIADGIADLNYVSYGTAIACGLDMEPIEQEVHKNNMAKMWSGEEITDIYSSKEIEKLKLDKLPPGKYKGFYVVKDKHGKILKPPGHDKPNLEPLIKQQE